MLEFEVKLLAAITIVGLVLLNCAVARYRHSQRLRQQYPRITDDEFMAKLPPGTSRDTALRVRDIVAEQLGIERELIHPDSKFVDLIDL